MFLSNTLTDLWMIKLFFMEKVFVIIVYKLLKQQMHWTIILNSILELMVNERVRWLKRLNMSNSKIMKEK